jgi:hypothetical protein
VWPSERRLLALSGPWHTRVTPVVVDPERRRVVRHTSWRGRAIHWARAGKRLVVLAAGDGGTVVRHGRLVSFDGQGRVRQMRMGRIEAGTWQTGGERSRNVEPGLAVTAAGDRAYVVAADGGLVADIDLDALRLAYHDVSEARSAWQRVTDLITPPAYAKGPYESAIRSAQTLPGGGIAVWGEDQETTGPRDRLKTVGYGVKLIDPDSWTRRTIDTDAQWLTVAGGTLLARRWTAGINRLPSIGIRGYDTAGQLRFSRFRGESAIVVGAADDHAYIGAGRGRARRIHVIDLDSGKTDRVLPYRQLRLLDRTN